MPTPENTINVHYPNSTSFGRDGATISLASTDFAVPADVRAIVVVAAGNVVFRPIEGDTDITITGAEVGFILPWRCSVIRKTGTTATVATLG
jgi:hypothetical protein